jgi:K+-transporting ATPase KdpF subunit
MGFEYAAGMLIAIALTGYLLFALIRPERF